MRVYGGYNTYQNPYSFSIDEEYLLNKGIGFVFTILSGDGNFGWNGFLNGNQQKITNVIEDIKDITNNIYQNKFCTKKSIILRGESYGAYIAASTIISNPSLFDSGILRAGEYDAREAIINQPARIEQFGDLENPAIQRIHEKLSPINQIKNVSVIPPLFITNYEFDSNVSNKTAYKFIEELDKKGLNYYFHLLKSADHINSRSYYQALNHFYLENLYLLSRLEAK